MKWVGSSRWLGFARWGGWELGLLSTTQKGVWTYCSFHLYPLTKKFHFDIRENNLQARWRSSIGADLWERLWHFHPWRYSELDWTWPWATWSYFKVSFNFEAVLALTKVLNQMTFRGPYQPRLFYDSVPEAAWLGRAELCCSQKETALVQYVPALPALGHCPMLGSHVFLAKCGWEEQMSAEPEHPSATPGIWSAPWYSHYYLAPCATENWMWRVNAFEFIIGTLIFLFESTLTVSFKTSDKNSSVWKPAGV